MPLDCNNNNLSLDQIMNAILTTDDNGNCAVRLIPVADGDADWVDCDSKDQDFSFLIRRIIGVDVNNKLGIRVIQGTDSGVDCIDCQNKSLPYQELVARHVIGLAADGHPALRLATL